MKSPNNIKKTLLKEILAHYLPIGADPKFILGEEYLFPQPFSKKLDLKVDTAEVEFAQEEFLSDFEEGSPSSEFIEIHEVILNLEFTDNSVSWLNFGDASALTNGMDIHYHFGDSKIFVENIKSNADILFNSETPRIFSDDQGASKHNIIHGIIDFESYSRDGVILDLSRGDKFSFDVLDDLSALTNVIEFDAIIRGSYLIRYE